jgi:hypothetical protein
MLGFKPLVPQFWCVSSRSPRGIVEHLLCSSLICWMALGLHSLVPA